MPKIRVKAVTLVAFRASRHIILLGTHSDKYFIVVLLEIQLVVISQSTILSQSLDKFPSF